ncbi:MAG: hypothetical protein NTV22_15555 [bacterium]|nr:hypothetical protein [bacterium]
MKLTSTNIVWLCLLLGLVAILSNACEGSRSRIISIDSAADAHNTPGDTAFHTISQIVSRIALKHEFAPQAPSVCGDRIILLHYKKHTAEMKGSINIMVCQYKADSPYHVEVLEFPTAFYKEEADRVAFQITRALQRSSCGSVCVDKATMLPF